MFILDTNVVSELMRPAPDPAIASWVAERATSSLFLTAVTEAELRFGLAVMPPGKRRDGLAAGLERMLETGFANRILPFDSAAARAYAGIAAARRRRGRPPAQADCQIAAIARSRGMAVATRKRSGFRGDGDRCIQPMGRRMSGTTEAFSRVKIDALLRDAGWDPHRRCEGPLRMRAAGRHSVRLRPLWTGPGVLWRHLKSSVPTTAPCSADRFDRGRC